MAAQGPHDATVTLAAFTVWFSQALLYYILHIHASFVDVIFMYNTKNRKPAVRNLSVAFALTTKFNTTSLTHAFPVQGANQLDAARVRLEQQIASQLVKKFPAFYGTRRFITVYTYFRHLSMS